MNYLELRKKLIEKDYGRMNNRQFEAVVTVDGPLLVLAGAGSGKTTVLVNRIANIVKYGNAYLSDAVPYYTDEDIAIAKEYLDGIREDLPTAAFAVNAPRPWEILAITFTNKAAGELKERIAAKLGEGGCDVWAGTFHSVCGKILRRNADLIGFTSHFTIYDTDDQKRLMKDIMKSCNVDEKLLPLKSVLSEISSAKDELIDPVEYEKYVGGDLRKKTVAGLYKIYQRRLKEADAMDFDDMIIRTIELFETSEETLSYYQNRFKYIMVDEYQDTNHAQFVLVSLLAGGKGNLCVVGDDDQSIYRFRGATIENILNFESQFRGAKTIRLEQNYRSTSNILDAANAVIANNLGRKGKNLWTDKGAGEKITVYTAADERSEARYIADCILESVKNGNKFSDHAVLYRMNAQSASLEGVFARSGISYKVIGGFRFFERKEIKDALAYLNVINNHNDNVRLRRIINEPKRGIGETTVNNSSAIAEQLGISLFEVFSRADEFASVSRSAAKLKEFTKMIEDLSEIAENGDISELYNKMLEYTGYLNSLKAAGKEEQDRVENVEELGTVIKQFELENDEPTLSAFLEEIALVSDTDSLDEDDDKVVLMTIHSAKGLEFNKVYLVAMEEGIFPGSQSIYAGQSEIEEERRLAYVAITRARKNLTITNASSRMLYGSTSRNLPSRFLKEIPESLCSMTAQFGGDSFFSSYTPRRSEGQSYSGSFDRGDRSYSGGYGYSSKPQKSYVASQSAAAPKSNAGGASYTAGQTVEHKVFGKGLILSVKPMGADSMLEIAFDTVGTKKIMAGYAKLTVI
ncbi:MAG: UvrD-helicase domain-containing protein [Clostridia bacterium]|nr:UvrD-helicase domain-containing protein [Clostridia bacterium]